MAEFVQPGEKKLKEASNRCFQLPSQSLQKGCSKTPSGGVQ